jgi:hypothetical protein
VDRLERGPMFRETTNGDFRLARQALESSLRDLFERKKMAQAHKWIMKFLKTFEEHAQNLRDQDARGEIVLKDLLFPVPGRMHQHQKELDAILEKYVILPADKCRGNYLLVCKNTSGSVLVHCTMHQNTLEFKLPEMNSLQDSCRR